MAQAKKTETKKRDTRALVAFLGVEAELAEIQNDTAAIMFKGMRTMTGVWNVEPINKKARDMIAKAKAED